MNTNLCVCEDSQLFRLWFSQRCRTNWEWYVILKNRQKLSHTHTQHAIFRYLFSSCPSSPAPAGQFLNNHVVLHSLPAHLLFLLCLLNLCCQTQPVTVTLFLPLSKSSPTIKLNSFCFITIYELCIWIQIQDCYRNLRMVELGDWVNWTLWWATVVIHIHFFYWICLSFISEVDW